MTITEYLLQTHPAIAIYARRIDDLLEQNRKNPDPEDYKRFLAILKAMVEECRR